MAVSYFFRSNALRWKKFKNFSLVADPDTSPSCWDWATRSATASGRRGWGASNPIRNRAVRRRSGGSEPNTKTRNSWPCLLQRLLWASSWSTLSAGRIWRRRPWFWPDAEPTMSIVVSADETCALRSTWPPHWDTWLWYKFCCFHFVLPFSFACNCFPLNVSVCVTC